MNKIHRTFLPLFLMLPAVAHAAFFSTGGVINGASSYSVTVEGITMTIDSTSSSGLPNFPDAYSGIDFGVSPFSYAPGATSFEVSFNQSMSVSGFNVLTNIFNTYFSIAGSGVYALADSSVVGNVSFVNGPLEFLANEKYTFSYVSGGVFPFGGLEAVAVPIPSNILLFCSSLFGLIGLSRKQKI